MKKSKFLIKQIKNKNTFFFIDKKYNFKIKYIEINYFVDYIYLSLNKYGINKKSKIILLIDNSFYLPLLYFTAIKYQITLMPLESLNNVKELNIIKKKYKFDYILTDNIEINEQLNSIYNKLFIDIKKNKIELKKYYKLNKKNKTKKINFNSSFNFLCCLTSGTTGIKKYIYHSSNNLFNNANNFLKFHNIRTRLNMYHTFSMSYMAGILNCIIIPFQSRGIVYFEERFNITSSLNFLKFFNRSNANTIWMAPFMLNLLNQLNYSNFQKINFKKKIKYLFCATSQLDDETYKNFKNKFGITPVQTYGLSETLIISSNIINNQYNNNGKSLTNVKIKLSKKNEILVKSKSTFTQFKNDEYFKTGDLGSIDKNSNLLITGRLKELIIKKGLNISPYEIESLLINKIKVPYVIYGTKDYIYGDKICLGYINNRNMNSYLKKICEKNLPKKFIPDIYKKFDRFPYSNNGKIQRKLLKT